MSRHRHRGHLNPLGAITVGLLRIERGLPARSADQGAKHSRGD